MRLLAASVLVLVLLAAAPVAPADVGTGVGYGVDAFYVSAGPWDLWHLYVDVTGKVWANLTWTATAPIRTDFDLTLWKPGAYNDKVLAQDEMIAKSWNYTASPRFESVNATLTANSYPYVLTVEPTRATASPYTLTVTGARLIKTCNGLSPPSTCIPAAAGAKIMPP